MGDMNEIISGRSLMRRVQPLLLAMNALRRREEMMERGPGVMPNREQGAQRNDGERVLGRGSNFGFLGRSWSFPAQIDAHVR